MKKCIIMGNGPSVNDMPRDVFASLPSYGVNYCKYHPTYFVCVDHDILTKYPAKIYEVAKRAEITYISQKDLGGSNLYELPNVELVSHDRDAFYLEHYFSGLTVVYVALKLAYYAGFEEVHLWGVDHSADWAHYRDDYPVGAVDRRAYLMGEMFYHYELASRVYNTAGRAIVNHSLPSKLDTIFQRVGKDKL